MERQLLGAAREISGLGAPRECKGSHELNKTRKDGAPAFRGMRIGLRMEAEFQLDGRFGAGRVVLPALQRLFDSIPKQRMTADDLRFLDLSGGGDHNLHLYDAAEATPLCNFRLSRNGSENH